MERMKLWHLDNEYSDYIIVAETEDEVWEKLRVGWSILPPDEPEDEIYDLQPAYHDIVEVDDGYPISHTDGLYIVL